MKIYKYGMKRPFGMGTFPKNDSVIGPDANNDRNISGFYDILLTSSPLSEKEIYDFELSFLDKNSILEKIAFTNFDIETLETRMSDGLDFHEVSVWGLKQALEEAYAAGQINS